MKIAGIKIDDYRQFKNISFDFTYPSDYHDPEKAGNPLDKVCFIGQSGTGKTTLLKIIWDFFQVVNDGFQISGNNFFVPSVTHYDTFKGLTLYSAGNGNTIDFGGKDLRPTSDLYIDNSKDIAGSSFDFIKKYNLYNLVESFDKLCIFIKDSISREADAFLFNQKEQPQIFSDFIKTDTQVEKEKVDRVDRINAISLKKLISLGDMQSLSTWQYLLREINDYDETTVAQITKIIQNTHKSKVAEELQRWIDADPRIELFEKCLSPILNKFFLEISRGSKDNAPISLYTKQGNKVPSSDLSTGTRQLLATAIPIYKFDTTDTVILFDEPERSLFPDIQRELVKYYTSLAPTAQFFFATHSPIIASAFEPCERFILYFDENGEVKYRNGVAPIGDDPNDILSEDFGLNELMLDEGLEAYKRYRNLAVTIRNEKDSNRKNALIAERAKLGDDYKF